MGDSSVCGKLAGSRIDDVFAKTPVDLDPSVVPLVIVGEDACVLIFAAAIRNDSPASTIYL